MDKLRKGWEFVKLGQIMDFKNGLNFTKSDTGEQIKIVGVSNFKDRFELETTNDLDMVSVSNKIKDDELLANGDLLFVRSNGNKELIGRCLYFPCVKERLSFSGFTIRGRVKSEKVLPKYISHLARSSIIKRNIQKQGGGTNISNLSQQILNDIVIHLPPLPEQIKIAEILSAWDNAIQTTEKQLANSQQQKKALMQMLLSGEKRVAGFSGEWCECYLSEIAYITTGSSNRQDSSSEGEYTFFDRSEDIRKSNIYLFDKEAVIVAGEGQQFTPKYFVGKFDLHQRTYAIMDFQLCVGKFIYYLIDFKKDYFLSQAVGSTVKSLRLPMFQKMKLMLPKSIEEQQKIAEILTTADQEIKTLQRKLECLKLEKRALMQKLL